MEVETMKVVTIAAPKGGSCKTTTTTLLAVKATHDGKNVCLIDLNADQANLAQWHISRGEPMLPHLEHKITNITRDVAAIRASGKFDWLFIDTPPLDMDVIENAVVVADAVIIPVRASIFDVGAVGAIVEMCREHHKPFAFLRSAFDSRFKSLNQSALAALVPMGQVLGTTISYRLPYINAATAGKTGPEIEKELQLEVNALWTEVQQLAGKAHPKAVKGRAAND
jgi:chromosome partitioning protein